MNQYSMRKMLSLIGCIVLIAAMALSFTGCGGSSTTETTTALVSETTDLTAHVTALGEGATSFSFTVVDLEGNETAYEIHTDETTVGAALLAVGLIEGDEGEYGLYVTAVNGITADWDKDQTYWAFYVDGEYGMTGVDVTEITAGTAYSFVLTKG